MSAAEFEPNSMPLPHPGGSIDHPPTPAVEGESAIDTTGTDLTTFTPTAGDGGVIVPEPAPSGHTGMPNTPSGITSADVDIRE